MEGARHRGEGEGTDTRDRSGVRERVECEWIQHYIEPNCKDQLDVFKRHSALYRHQEQASSLH